MVLDHDLGSNWPSCILMSTGSTVHSQTRICYFQELPVLWGALPRFDLHLEAKENLSRVCLYAVGAPCDALFPQSPIVLHAGHCFWKSHLQYVPHTRSMYESQLNCYGKNGLGNRTASLIRQPWMLLSLYGHVTIREKILLRSVVSLKTLFHS